MGDVRMIANRRLEFVALALVALVTGCASSPPAPPTPVPAPSVSATVGPASEAPASPEEPPSLPARSDDAIASSMASNGAVTSATGTVSADAHYVVRAACVGAEEMTYRLMLAGKEISSSTWSCGKVVENTATTAGEQGVIEVQLVDPSAGATGFAEVVRRD